MATKEKVKEKINICAVSDISQLYCSSRPVRYRLLSEVQIHFLSLRRSTADKTDIRKGLQAVPINCLILSVGIVSQFARYSKEGRSNPDVQPIGSYFRSNTDRLQEAPSRRGCLMRPNPKHIKEPDIDIGLCESRSGFRVESRKIDARLSPDHILVDTCALQFVS